MREKKAVDDRMIREIPGALLEAKEPRWEYMTVIGANNCDLDRFGADRWELVAAIAQPGDRTAYYFKRRK